MQKRVLFLVLLFVIKLINIKANEVGSLSVYDSLMDDTIYVYVDCMPELLGVDKSIQLYILRNNNLNKCIEVEFRFKLSFIVEKDGGVSNIKINDRGVRDELNCSEREIYDSVEKMKWRPGTNNKEPKRVQFDVGLTLSPNHGGLP